MFNKHSIEASLIKDGDVIDMAEITNVVREE